jgi:iron complex outermembrane receptor protein
LRNACQAFCADTLKSTDNIMTTLLSSIRCHRDMWRTVAVQTQLLILAVWLTTSSLPAQSAAPVSPAASDEPVTLNPFTVSASADRGYLSNNSISASRVDTPIIFIPQSIFVLTKELLRDQNPLDVNELLRYAPGVITSTGIAELPTVRGFQVTLTLTNGFRTARGFPSEQADIDRTEVLFGPASVLYGNVFGMSGVVNRITKKPLFHRESSVQLQWKDEQETLRTVLDTTGPFGRSDRLAYRMIAAAQRSKLPQDFRRLDRVAFFPKFTYKLNATTSLDLELEHLKQSQTSALGGNGVSLDYWLNGRIVEVPRASNPDAHITRMKTVRNGATLVLTTRLGAHWAARVGTFNYSISQAYNQNALAASINADGMTINRTAGGNMVYRERWIGNFINTVDVSGAYDFSWGKLKPLFSVDCAYDPNKSPVYAAATPLPAFNLFKPDYAPPAPTTYRLTTDLVTDSAQWTGTGLVQAEMLKERLILTGGLRVADFRQAVTDRIRSTKSILNQPAAKIPRVGFVLRPLADLSLYYSYGEAYQPATSANPDGSTFAPLTGKQNEVGLKSQLFNGRLAFTAAYYKLIRENALQADPFRPGYQIASGKEQASGYDVSIVATPLANWQIILGYARTEGKILAAVAAASVGLGRTGVPPDYANLWMRYAFRSGRLKNLSLGAGMVYASQNPVLVPNATGAPGRYLPGYQTYDMMASYDWTKAFRIQLNLRNLLDRRFYPQGNTGNLLLGDPRTLSVIATHRF